MALSCGGRSWSYRQLDEASNRLAHLLIDYGAVRGVCGVVVAALRRGDHRDPGVLKSGAAYLPIDPAHPVERIGFMLADAAPLAVITTTGLADRLDGHDVAVIDINDPRINTQTQHQTCRPGPR
ncbi:linear gramicidin synthetase subunit D [Mycobacterium xenopi]|nr:linear gramicidin synthetase subunit D [Mycobacterium xenopi]